MKQMSHLKNLIIKSSLYPAARLVYRAFFNRDANAHRTRMGAFYSQFFQRGDIVFDVGANQGEYSEMYAAEGGCVVALEPNNTFSPRLNALARIYDIRPVIKAVGDLPGQSILNVCSTPGFSTLIAPGVEWMDKSPDYKSVTWTDKLEIEVTTLDILAEQFGQPEYVKIDVEEYEINVLRGMTFNPRYLSFEFGARRKGPSQECLDNMGAAATDSDQLLVASIDSPRGSG